MFLKGTIVPERNSMTNVQHLSGLYYTFYLRLDYLSRRISKITPPFVFQVFEFYMHELINILKLMQKIDKAIVTQCSLTWIPTDDSECPEDDVKDITAAKRSSLPFQICDKKQLNAIFFSTTVPLTIWIYYIYIQTFLICPTFLLAIYFQNYTIS